MSNGVLGALTLVAALGSGIVGGVFFGFSALVMKSLARLRPAQGIVAMQSINVMAIRPPLMVPFFGTALACLGLAVSSLSRWQEAWTMLRLVGSGLYVIGTIVTTMVRNVPLNTTLATVDPDSESGAAQWATYVPRWTAWNSVRTIAAIAAAAMFTVAYSVGNED